MRTFTCTDDKSNKFWTIDLQGRRFTVQFGKVGTAGQKQVKEFADEATALKAHDKLIAEKVAKGYEETVAPAPSPEKATPGPGGPSFQELCDSLPFWPGTAASLDDLTPRLAFADWLHEQGQVGRAEFIRVQCRLLAPDLAVDDWGFPVWGTWPAEAERNRLRAQAEALLKKHRRAWLGKLPVPKSGPWGLANFTGGFLDTLVIRPEMTKQELHQLVGLTDWRRLVCVGDGWRVVGPLLQSRNCPRFLSLAFAQRGVCGVGIGDRRAQELAQSRGLASLTSLDLVQNEIGTEGALALAGSPHLPRLTSLNLSHNEIGDAGVCALAASPNLGSLTSLSLGGTGVGDAGAVALAASPYLGQLTALDLSRNGIGVAGVRALPESPHLARLTALDLGYNEPGFGDEGARALAESPHLACLTVLCLQNGHNYHLVHRIGVEGARALAGSPHLARLTSLNLLYNELGPGGARALARSRHLARLTSLHLGGNSLDARSAQALADSPYLAQLTALNLSENWIGAKGVQALAESPHLARLTTLNLVETNIGDEGARALAKSPYLAQLVDLSLGSGLSERVEDLLQQRWPFVRFWGRV
jgi:uncharacterized protein (TIGR02996 family)